MMNKLRMYAAALFGAVGVVLWFHYNFVTMLLLLPFSYAAALPLYYFFISKEFEGEMSKEQYIDFICITLIPSLIRALVSVVCLPGGTNTSLLFMILVMQIAALYKLFQHYFPQFKMSRLFMVSIVGYFMAEITTNAFISVLLKNIKSIS